MGFIKTREPRKFRPVHIYTDERQDRLRRLVNDVKREQGEQVDEPYDPARFKGQFAKYTPHTQKHADGVLRTAWPVVFFGIILLVMLIHWLLTGKVTPLD